MFPASLRDRIGTFTRKYLSAENTQSNENVVFNGGNPRYLTHCRSETDLKIWAAMSSSNEEQPLLTDSIGKSWDAEDRDHGVTDINVDSFHNGLSRRIEKNDVHHSSSNGTVKISLPPPEREESRFPPEKWKTLVSLTFMFSNLVLNVTVLAIIHDRVPDRKKYPPLPDIFFDIFPPCDWALSVSEIIIMSLVWLTLLIIFIHRHRFIILRRCFMILGILYFLRSITMLVTQVPVASTTYFCSPKANSTTPLLVVKRVLHLLGGFGLSINGHHTFCGDYIFSGHTVILSMAFLVIQEYTPRKCIILQWLTWLACCTGIFMILLSRGHYLLDVVLGYYLTTRVFWIYHMMANNAFLKTSSNTNLFSKIWWFPVFTYFEKNVGGVVPRQYEWPLPWPRRFLRHTRIS